MATVKAKRTSIGNPYTTEANAPSNTRSYKRICEYQAEQFMVDVEFYQHVCDITWETKAAEHNEREAAKKYARKITGLNKSSIEKLDNLNLDYSADGLGLDVYGRELAAMYPSLGWGNGSEDQFDDAEYDRLIWELIAEGAKPLVYRICHNFHDLVEGNLDHVQAMCGM